jgi:hypothetical protein
MCPYYLDGDLGALKDVHPCIYYEIVTYVTTR